MSHQITSTDGFFTVRENAWHGLGVVLPEYPTREEAQHIAHPWEPVSEPIYRKAMGLDDDGILYERYEAVPEYVANVRSDNAALLGVVSDGFQTVTNNELWDIAEALQGGGAEVRYETGGSLKGGAKVWVLLKLDEPLVVNGDPHGETLAYYSLQNAHDGSGSFRGQATMTRIVCANTAHIADLDAQTRGTEFTFRHTKNVGQRVEEARAALAGWRQSVAQWQLFSEHLIDERFDSHGHQDAVVGEFLDRFIPEPPAAIITDRVRGNIERERDVWLSIYDGVTNEGLKGTAYGLVQTSVEYAEHFRKARTAETRFKRSFLDRNGVVQQATKLALEAVHA